MVWARLSELVPHFFGLLAALLLVWILTLTIAQLPPHLIEVAAAHGVKDFWFVLFPTFTFNFLTTRSVIVQLLLAIVAGLAITGEGVELFAQLQFHLQGFFFS